MSWLHTLINSLNETELSKLQQLRTIGKERAVLEVFLNARETTCPEPAHVCEATGISDKHYYKINSVLLNKIIATIQPQGAFQLIQWLHEKELYPILKNELKSQLKQEHDSDYYLKVFRLMIDLPYKQYDEALTKLVGNHYLQALHNCAESDRMYVKYHLLFSDCNRFAAARNPEKRFQMDEAALLEAESELVKKKYSLALYYLYRTLCNYYNYYKGDAEKSLRYLEKAIQLKDAIAPFFPIPIEQFLRLLYADALLGFGALDEAYQSYKELFKQGLSKDMYGYYYHCEQFVLSSILLRKYAEAEQLLHQYFDECIERSQNIYATRGVLAYAKLYLSTGEWKKAQGYINSGIQMNEKTFYLPFELQLRVLENCFFFFKDDLEFARQLAQRNLKFVMNQKSKEMVRNYRLLFKLIHSFILCRENGKSLTNNQQQDLVYLNNKFRNVYGELLDKMNAHLKTK